jgi:hypothetical protein
MGPIPAKAVEEILRGVPDVSDQAENISDDHVHDLGQRQLLPGLPDRFDQQQIMGKPRHKLCQVHTVPVSSQGQPQKVADPQHQKE